MKDKRLIINIFTIITLILIIYFITRVEQTKFSCYIGETNQYGVKLKEYVDITLKKDKINDISYKKTIIIPQNYISDIKDIKRELEYNYKYLKGVNIIEDGNKITIKAKITKGTIILNPLSFTYTNKLETRFKVNTKSPNNITLSIGDEQTEGKLTSNLSKKGYRCS